MDTVCFHGSSWKYSINLLFQLFQQFPSKLNSVSWTFTPYASFTNWHNGLYPQVWLLYRIKSNAATSLPFNLHCKAKGCLVLYSVLRSPNWRHLPHNDYFHKAPETNLFFVPLFLILLCVCVFIPIVCLRYRWLDMWRVMWFIWVPRLRTKSSED